MNKQCPGCKKPVTKKDKHVFVNGQRYHADCVTGERDDEPASIERDVPSRDRKSSRY
jgi:hypothetical protein